jgi:hypothetical protein
MALPNLASREALEQRLGATLDPTEAAQADSLLGYASALVRAYTRATWMVDGLLVDAPDGVSQVVVEMVYRAVSNPQGVTQDTTGPFSVSFGPQAAQRIYLSAGDKTILGSIGRGQSFSVDTVPRTGVLHGEACSLRFGANYCDCGADIAGYPLYGT